MAPRYHQLRDRTIAAVDRVWAELVLIAPKKDGVSDPDRQTVTISAPLRTGPGKATDLAGGYSRDWRARIAAGKSELRIDRTKYPALVIQSGDKVRAIERTGEPWFEVLHVDDRNHARLVVALGEV